jgi:SagB-type dehydrogenase family enzyme
MNSPAAEPDRRLARRPRMRRGLAVASTDAGMLVEGGSSRQLLAGPAAPALLPRLLSSLDGRHAPEQICKELSLDRDQFDRALSQLDGCGLLEWVVPGRGTGFAAEHVATYMSRTAHVTDSCPSADDLASYLGEATVLLVASAALAQLIAADLKETGVGTVASLTAADTADAPPGVTGHCVAAVFDDPADEQMLDLLVSAFQDRDVPVLRFSRTVNSVEVGPVFSGIETACVRCFRRSRLPDARNSLLPGAGEPGTAEIGVLACLVVSALLGLLARQGPPVPWRRVARTVWPGPITELYDVVPDLECASCAGGTPPPDRAARELLGYEWRMGKLPPSLEPDSVLTPAAQTRLAALQQARDSFAYAPRHKLPVQPDHGVPRTAESACCLDEATLAAILAYTAGFRPAIGTAGHALRSRWAPSGGSMASVTLYLGTEMDLFGSPGTIFRYDDIEHEVISLCADRVALTQILDGTDLDPARADVVLVLVGAVGRLREKYDDFAWRLTHLDTGCAALQLQLVAAGYGLRVTFASAWPAQLAELLELDPLREVVTAVASVSATPRPPRPAAERRSLCQ